MRDSLCLGKKRPFCPKIQACPKPMARQVPIERWGHIIELDENSLSFLEIKEKSFRYSRTRFFLLSKFIFIFKVHFSLIGLLTSFSFCQKNNLLYELRGVPDQPHRLICLSEWVEELESIDGRGETIAGSRTVRTPSMNDSVLKRGRSFSRTGPQITCSLPEPRIARRQITNYRKPRI